MNISEQSGELPLTDAQQVALADLLIRCNQAEGIEIPFAEAGDEVAAGETGLFVAQRDGIPLGVASFGGMAEASIAVAPEQRRQGIGRALLDAVCAEARKRGRSEFLLVCDARSQSGRAFAEALCGPVAFSEHSLLLDPSTIDHSRPRIPNFRLQLAGEAALETLTRIRAAAFGDPLDSTRAHVAAGLADPTRQHWLGMLDTTPIGLLRIGRYDDFADVTSFGVLPEQQGHGYGRQMLNDAVALLLSEEWQRISIDVETDNRNALGLYLSCGFQPHLTYDYYNVSARLS